MSVSEPAKKQLLMCGHCHATCDDMDTLKAHMRAVHVAKGTPEGSIKISVKAGVLPVNARPLKLPTPDVQPDSNVSKSQSENVAGTSSSNNADDGDFHENNGTIDASSNVETLETQPVVEKEIIEAQPVTGDSALDDSAAPTIPVGSEESMQQITNISVDEIPTVMELPVGVDSDQDAPRQNVMVFRQMPDGTRACTGQTVQLTQSQIQELMTRNAGQVVSIPEIPETPGRAKRLPVMDSQSIEILQESAAQNEAKNSEEEADMLSHDREVVYFISAESDASAQTEHILKLNLKFQVAMSENEADLFPNHVTPQLMYRCNYCDYKDYSLKKASLHMQNLHTNDEGEVVAERLENLLLTQEILLPETYTCHYCLLKYDSKQELERHRKTACGSKRRYEIKRQAVRTLHKHLLCQVDSCGRDLYLHGQHRAEMKHPRCVYGVTHRSNGPNHYFTCYVCSMTAHADWRNPGNAAIRDKVHPLVKAQLDFINAQEEEDSDIPVPPPSDFTSRVLQPDELQDWDFQDWAGLMNHMADKHHENLLKPPLCTECDVIFKNVGSLCIHVFNQEMEFIQIHIRALNHRSKMHNSPKFLFGVGPDNKADKMLFDNGDEDTRMKVGSRYRCKTCGRVFSTSTSRDKHVLSNACVKESQNAQRKFECRHCNRKFHQRKTYIAHEVWCGYKAKRKRILDENDEPVEGNENDDQVVESLPKRPKRPRAKDFKCDIPGCSIGFESEQEMDIHKACHVQESLALRCVFCEHRTASSIAWFPLKEHIIAKHPGHIKPRFECQMCDKGFAKKSKFDDHMTTHSEAKAFTCIECGSNFKQESGLRAHVQAEHGPDEYKEMVHGGTKKKIDQPVMLCYVCGYSTRCKSYFQTHMNIHKGVKPFSCKHCDYKTVDSACFRRHTWRHREDKPYKCPYCAFDGIQRAQIVSHMKSKHNVYGDSAKLLIRTPKTNRARIVLAPPDQELSGQTVTVISASDIEQARLEGQNSSQTTSVSIVNPDGTETTVPVELITQVAGSDEAGDGDGVQVRYGDYMVSYIPSNATESNVVEQVIEEV